MRREITVGGGHTSGTLGWHHFGIGVEKAAQVRMTWPDGTVGEWQTVDAGRFYVVERSGGLTEWK
jgi:hypothetical protein